jgi:hypothetical protein
MPQLELKSPNAFDLCALFNLLVAQALLPVLEADASYA